MKRAPWGVIWVVVVLGAGGESVGIADDEDLVVTPAGFSRAGVAEGVVVRGVDWFGSRFGIARATGWHLAG